MDIPLIPNNPMCTATWLRHDDGFTLCFNRDESKLRDDALPPTIHTIDNTKVLMPIDPEGGGSWIAANEHGLVICLLNHYGATINHEERDWMSRGLIVRSLSSVATIADVDEQIQQFPLSRLRGFQVLALSSCGTQEDNISSWVWDGHLLVHVHNGQPIFSSSAFNTQPVISTRVQNFEQHIANSSASVNSLREFHRSHNPMDGSCGVCMDRPEAQTVSYTEITVSAANVEMHYLSGRPSQTSEQPLRVNLPRTSS